MGRPKGAKATRPRIELEVIGLDELPAEIAEWEIQLVARRLRAMVAASTRSEIEGGNDAAE